MLNHTYTSVKNANIVDCGKKQHIPSQPLPLLRNNYLGEYRTDLDRKKVLANLGIATDLSLEWEYIKGDIGRSESLIKELDSRTKYISQLDGFQKTIIQGIEYLETIVGGEEEAEGVQNDRLKALEDNTKQLNESLDGLKTYIQETVDVNIDTLQQKLEEVTEKVNNITNLIQVSTKENNALVLIPEGSENLKEGETPGLYVPDLSEEVSTATQNIGNLQTNVKEILDTYVTKDQLGGGDFNFVHQDTFNQHVTQANTKFNNIDTELAKTVKTGEDGHVDTLYVNKISKNNNDENIVITDSFEVDSNIPLDVRFVRQTLEELYALPVGVCYPGMGVIVNSLSSLYILRKPLEGVKFDQDYIKNPNNWKCPEDLVTVALPRQEYDSLSEINPNVFYYIYEDEITRTSEPKREEYSTDEEFQKEWQKWTDSLKTLSQEYMSAAWGVDIENKLGKKASSISVSILAAEINNIKGNGSGPSLESLNNSIKNLEGKDDVFKDRLDEILTKVDDREAGRLVTAERGITNIENKLSEYVTKDYIQDSENDFIFVKESIYNEDKEQFEQQLSEQINTKEVITDLISLDGKKLEGTETRLQYNDVEVANLEDIPEIKILSQKDYDNLSDKKDDVYYYTFDGDNIYVTKEDLDRTSSRLQKQINVLYQGGTAEDIENTLGVIFLPIETWKQFQQQYNILEERVSNLQKRMDEIQVSSVMYTGSSIYISGKPDECYQDENTIHLKTDKLTYGIE